jgi:hypothetical protein
MKNLFKKIFSASASSDNSYKQIISALNLDELHVKPELILDISKTLKTPPVNNFKKMLRLQQTGEPESYEEVAAGIKFRGIPRELASMIIEKYFEKVKAAGNYLYLTNFIFDKSFQGYYDIVIAPVSNQLDLIRFVEVDPKSSGLTIEDVCNWFAERDKEFGIQIYFADIKKIDAYILSEPKSYENLAEAISKFSPVVIEDAFLTKEAMIKYLQTEKSLKCVWD